MAAQVQESGVMVFGELAPWALDVFVAGNPATKGSTRAFVVGGKNTKARAVVTADNSVHQREWAAYARDVLGEAWGGAATRSAVCVVMDVAMPRRKGNPRTGGTPWRTTKPDGDKLERAIWDALTHVVYVDDAQVVTWAGSKRDAEPDETPGARVRVAVLPGRTL